MPTSSSTRSRWQEAHCRFQFYYIVACPTQEPESSAERLVYESERVQGSSQSFQKRHLLPFSLKIVVADDDLHHVFSFTAVEPA